MSFVSVPSSLYNSTAYFYANSTNVMGPYSKDVSKSTLVFVDYAPVTGALVESYTFSVDIGSAPPLVISSDSIIGQAIEFVISLGVPGVVYTLTINTVFSDATTRVDTIEIDVPSNSVAVMPIANILNVGNPITGEGAVFINSGVRLFVSATQPSGANILDHWYNLTGNNLWEFTSNGISTTWVKITH